MNAPCRNDEVAAEVHDTEAASPRSARAHLRSLLHNQAGGDRHGAGAGALPCFRDRDGWPDRSAEPCGARDDVPGDVAGGRGERVRASRPAGIEGGSRRCEAGCWWWMMILLVSSALRRTLAREHDVEVVVSSKRALEMLLSPEGLYDVILCDLMMPEMTGMELHAQLEAAKPERARRMVFVTGGAYTPAAMQFLDRGDQPAPGEALRAGEAARARARVGRAGQGRRRCGVGLRGPAPAAGTGRGRRTRASGPGPPAPGLRSRSPGAPARLRTRG